MTIDHVFAEEKERLTALLFSCSVTENRIQMLAPVIENVAWMKAKLDDTREQIRNTSVVIPYDNGGGQTGIRKNPLFEGYSSLWKSYMAGLNAIIAVLPKEAAPETANADTPKTVLQLVRDKHRKQA